MFRNEHPRLKFSSAVRFDPALLRRIMMDLPSRRRHGAIRYRIAGIKKWPSKAKHRIFKHRIARIKKITHRTLKGEQPDNVIPLADTDIVVVPTSSTSAPTDINSLPPEMLLAIFENLDSVQQQAIMRYVIIDHRLHLVNVGRVFRGPICV